MDNKKELETNKEDFLSFLGGTTEHKKVITKENGNYIQFDYLTTKISLNALADNAVALLDYWGVEDFDRAFIDWKNYNIILIHRTEHYLPGEFVTEVLKDPATLTSLEEE